MYIFGQRILHLCNYVHQIAAFTRDAQVFHTTCVYDLKQKVAYLDLFCFADCFLAKVKK